VTTLVSRDLRTAHRERTDRSRWFSPVTLKSEVAEDETLRAVPSWRPGHYVWPGGRTKLVLMGGLSTRTGDAERSFSGMIRFLADRGGYDPRRDVLEGTFAGGEQNGAWQPSPYGRSDTRRPLIDMAEALAGCLDFYRQALPSDTRLAVVGYSMGGVVGLDGATLAVARDRQAWQGRLHAVITLAAPLHGSSVGALVNWAWLVTGEPEGLGAAGEDLDARWKDADEQTRLSRRAAFLRSTGVRVLTLADPDDSVVRPEEALLPAPGESVSDLQVSSSLSRPGSLGHGAILDEPAVWRRLLAVLGPQSARGGSVAADPIEEELRALKARLRRQGRIQ
jgi:pimeloyl-ACP methyl ester carboxylesterase